MKKNLTQLFIGIGICTAGLAQTSMIGPSTLKTPYLQPIVPGSTVTSILTVSDVVGSYPMVGLPDGIGAYDNGNGSFTVLMNHEMGSTAGTVHAHGATGSFVSKWTINKATLSVTAGSDLIQSVNLWTGTTYTNYSTTNPSTLTAFGRFCSGDLPATTAFYNPATGKGTQERIYLNGEETGSEGRAFGHIATGTATGISYELPHLGKASWENYVASPYAQDKTIMIGMDDATPGQVYVYIGTKSTTGSDIVKAGLFGGKLYGTAVLGLINEVSSGFPAANTPFNLIDLGSVQNLTGSTLNTNSNNTGVSNFLRPEDGVWDPANPRDFYFVTTNAFANPSRLWRMRFNDINNPELGGTITVVLNGTEGHKMLDNLTMDHFGNILLQEDVGGNIHNGKIWQYSTVTNSLSVALQHDTTRFITGAANFLTIDEEASGMIDIQEILGPGMFLSVDQAHYSLPSPYVEGGQLLLFYNPTSANANPEINVQGNSVGIAAGSTVVSQANSTNFGSVNVSATTIRSFVVRNAGPGVLTVKSFSMGGVNAGDFGFIGSPAFPYIVPVNGSLTINVKFTPAINSIRKGIVYINNNDFDESVYTFAIEGTGVVPEIDVLGNNLAITNGDNIPAISKNTDLGLTLINIPVQKDLVVQNNGTGTLNIVGLNILGNNSSEFALLNLPAMPLNLNPGSALTLTLQYLPVTVGTRTAVINVMSDDADEWDYKFLVSAKATTDVGMEQLGMSGADLSVFPNPAQEQVNLKLSVPENQVVEITIQSVDGKVVQSLSAHQLNTGVNEIILDTNNLPDGMYIISVNSENSSSKAKLTVAH